MKMLRAAENSEGFKQSKLTLHVFSSLGSSRNMENRLKRPGSTTLLCCTHNSKLLSWDHFSTYKMA